MLPAAVVVQRQPFKGNRSVVVVVVVAVLPENQAKESSKSDHRGDVVERNCKYHCLVYPLMDEGESFFVVVFFVRSICTVVRIR